VSVDATCGTYVFSSPRTGKQITDIKTAWTSALEKAGIDNLTFHDLRHEWSSRAADMNVPEHVRRDILGHSSKEHDRRLHPRFAPGYGEGDGVSGRLQQGKYFELRQDYDKRLLKIISEAFAFRRKLFEVTR
jgi:hypothetical protein